MSENTAAVATADTATAPAVTKTKSTKTGNPLIDTAAVTETLTKTKALNLADKMVSDLDRFSFELGGVLLKIDEQGWWEGSASFGAFVAERYGFQERKARYLISIYKNLVEKNIPWEKIEGIGWTKLKDLAPILTAENVDEWVVKAKTCNVAELQALLKGPASEGESTKTTSDSTTLKFKGLKPDQVQTIQTALSKAKAELPTEFDNVALEAVSGAFLSGQAALPQATSLADQMKQAGWKKTIELYGELFGDIVDIGITPKTAEAAAEAAAE